MFFLIFILSIIMSLMFFSGTFGYFVGRLLPDFWIILGVVCLALTGMLPYISGQGYNPDNFLFIWPIVGIGFWRGYVSGKYHGNRARNNPNEKLDSKMIMDIFILGSLITAIILVVFALYYMINYKFLQDV